MICFSTLIHYFNGLHANQGQRFFHILFFQVFSLKDGRKINKCQLINSSSVSGRLILLWKELKNKNKFVTGRAQEESKKSIVCVPSQLVFEQIMEDIVGTSSAKISHQNDVREYGVFRQISKNLSHRVPMASCPKANLKIRTFISL